jgi:oligosaccharide translocation protein RFT1
MPSIAGGASLLIALQIVSRLLTFLANQLLLRFLTAQQLGLATQLEVYYLSVLFFSRESLRVAVQRTDLAKSVMTADGGEKDAASREGEGETMIQGRDGAAGRRSENRGPGVSSTPPAGANEDPTPREQAIVNLGYLPPLLSLAIAPVLAYAYLRSLPSTLSQNVVGPLGIYALASAVELLAEPGFALAQSRLSFKTRAAIEALATLARCATTFVWVAVTTASHRGSVSRESIAAFAIGQLVYGTVVFLGYAWYAATAAICSGPASSSSTYHLSILPSSVPGVDPSAFRNGLFHRPTVALASSMAAQSVVKHVLTQGDTLLVSILSTAEAQGIYALANNYGGLLARMAFQPIEESSRGYFSRLLSSSSSSSSGTPPETAVAGSDTSSEAALNSAPKQAADDLSLVLRGYILLSHPIIALGPSAAPPLLSFVAGRHWILAGAGSALAAYCYYLPLLAVNGVTEAFVSSVATRRQVHVQSVWMTFFSAVFAVAGYVTLRVYNWGAEGLVVANSVNMACRIVWSTWFISTYFASRKVAFRPWALRPSITTTVTCLVTAWLLARDATANLGPLAALIRVAAAAAPLLSVM